MKELIIELVEWDGHIDRQKMFLDRDKKSVQIQHEFMRPDGTVGIYQDEGSDIAIQDIDKVIQFLEEIKKEASNEK